MKTRLALISFTANGAKTGERLLEKTGDDFEACGFVSSRFSGNTSLTKYDGKLGEWTAEWFGRADCLVFVGACGIAVRAIAPFVKDKLADPAVIVIDEQARYCISLMSGHMGGANELAERFASHLGAMPIVTTATDLNSRFAVDLFAKNNNLLLTDRRLAKEISAAILAGEKVLLQSDFPVEGAFPPELTAERKKADCRTTIRISYYPPEDENTLWLVPKNIVLGIGCRKDTPQQNIESFVCGTLADHKLPIEAACAVASIDLKANEKGLIGFCADRSLPFYTYSSQQLSEVEGEFSPSAFVKGVTGVDNVCERSAVLHSGGKLLLNKQKGSGVTLAAAAGEVRLKF